MKPPPPILTFCQVYGWDAVAAEAEGAAVRGAVMATSGTAAAATVASVVRMALRRFPRIGRIPLSAAGRGMNGSPAGPGSWHAVAKRAGADCRRERQVAGRRSASLIAAWGRA